MDAAQVQNLIDAAIGQERINVAAVAAAAAAAAPAVVPAAFARTPALAHTGVLDLASSEGMKIYNAATAALSSKFSGGPHEIYLLLKDLKQRNTAFGWNGVTTVTIGGGPAIAGAAPPPVAITYDLLTQYGMVTLDQLRARAEVYENANGREAQNAHMMYQCLYNSLTDEAKLKVLSDHDDYEINTTLNGIISNGPMFLKVIIRNSTVDTMSTVFHIRGNLNQLKEYMMAINCDIELFNQYVTSQVEALAARGTESSDLLINLFEAYEIVPDRKFNKHIENKKDDYEEGAATTVNGLMHQALTKFKDLKRSKKWQAPTAEEEQIVALVAQVEQLKKFTKKSKSSSEKVADKIRKKRRDDDPKYAWKMVKPKQGETSKKEVNGKTYHWCPKHNAWTLHEPGACRLEKGENKHKQKGEEGELTMMQAMTEDSDIESDDDEE